MYTHILLLAFLLCTFVVKGDFEITDAMVSGIAAYDAMRLKIKLSGGVPPSISGVKQFMETTKLSDEEMATSLVARARCKYLREDFQASADSISLVGQLHCENAISMIRGFADSVTNEMVQAACLYSEARILGMDCLSDHAGKYRTYPLRHRVQLLTALESATCELMQKSGKSTEELIELGFSEQNEECQTWIDRILRNVKPDWDTSPERNRLLQGWIAQKEEEYKVSQWTKVVNRASKNANIDSSESSEVIFSDVPIIKQ